MLNNRHYNTQANKLDEPLLRAHIEIGLRQV